MNELFEKCSEGDGNSPALEDSADEPSALDGIEEPAAAEAALPLKGRVLVLENDPQHQQEIAEFLGGSGYQTVAVTSGKDAMNELLASEFTMLLCDFSTPSAPGDMFYRAVKLIRPSLRRRFVFMTNGPATPQVAEIAKSGGIYLLQKPFAMDALLPAIAFVEVVSGFETVVDFSQPAPQPVRPPEPAAPTPKPAIAPPSAARQETPPLVAAPQPSWLERRGLSLAVTTFLGIVIAFHGQKYWHARRAATSAAMDQSRLEAQWRELAPHLAAMESKRGALLTASEALRIAESRGAARPPTQVLGQPARVQTDQKSQRWTPLLRGISTAAGDSVELLQIHAKEKPSRDVDCELRVHGLARGAQARMAADRFRQTLDERLGKLAGERRNVVRIERLEELAGQPAAAPAISFIVIVTQPSHRAAGAASPAPR